MSYVEGSDLRELLRSEGRLEPGRTLHLLGQVADALDAAHAAGLIHRDVKPGNILVADEVEGAQAYVCDFGLARHASSVGSLTGERSFVGTIDYVPPEQIEGGPIDGRADVYSLGCVLFECLAGVRPFDRESELSVVFAHLNDPPPAITDLRPELPAAVDDVLATALAKSPADRYTTCGDFIHAMRAAQQGRVVTRRRARRRRSALAAVAVLAATAAVGGGLLAANSRSTPAAQAAITPTSIAGARLGLSAAAYEKLFGNADSFQTGQTSGFRQLVFAGPKVEVSFNQSGKAIIVTTWNKDYQTDQGIGPCSTVAELKAAYRNIWQPDSFSSIKGSVFEYLIGGNLVFAAPGPEGRPSKFVTAVGLYAGSAPRAAEPMGALPWGGYVTGWETPYCA